WWGAPDRSARRGVPEDGRGSSGGRDDHRSPAGAQKSVPEIATASRTRRSDNDLRLWLNSRGRTRTCDPTVNSRLLYQLSYAGSIDSKISQLPVYRQATRGLFR